MSESIPTSKRFNIILATLIAVVSVTAALAAWRTSVLASAASNASRQGTIDAIKKQAAENEDVRKLYEEAAHARDYAIYLAGVEVLEASQDAGDQALARNIRQYMLPILEEIASPLVSDAKYQNPDGTFDLEARLDDLRAETPDLAALDPENSFEVGAGLSANRLSLTIGAVILVLSLVWLGLAEIVGKHFNMVCIIIGCTIYVIGLLWWLVVETGLLLS